MPQMDRELLAMVNITGLRDIDAPDWVKRAWLMLGHHAGLECTICGKFCPTIPTSGLCDCGLSLEYGTVRLRQRYE